MPRSRWAISRSAPAWARRSACRSAMAARVGGRLASSPVVGGGRVYTIDTNATVRAFDAQTGGKAWESQFGTEKGNSSSLYGGGVAYDNGRIYATNGLGFVAALDERNGGVIWQVRPGGPLRGAPTVVGDAIYVMSQDNQIYSLKDVGRHDQLVERGIAGDRRRVRHRLAGVRAGHGGRRLLVGRIERLPLRERPPGVAGHAVPDQHPHQRIVAVGHRRQCGDRQRPGVRDRPGRPDGRARADQRPAAVGTQHRRDRHPVGRRRLGVRGHR